MARGPGRPRKEPQADAALADAPATMLVGVIARSFGWNDRKYLRGQTFEMLVADAIRYPRQVMMAEAAANYIKQEDAERRAAEAQAAAAEADDE
jgi:hypothetical protein